MVTAMTSQEAAAVVVANHYLHRRPPISHAYGLLSGLDLVGVVTFGTPASRHLQKSACPTEPAKVMELNRLWVDDIMPRNTESWFVSRALHMLPPAIVVSYADPVHGHVGYIYRALNFHYSGWTDMDRKTPRFDYVPADPTKHSRDAVRRGEDVATMERVRRVSKVKYWTVTGNKTDRKALRALCPWPRLDWSTTPPPLDQETP